MNHIESKIRPVCDALNEISGVHTLWSCEGHALRPSRPYVVFQAPEDTARRLQQHLYTKNIDGTLRFWWRQTANFQASGVLQWLVEAPSIPRWRYWPVARRTIDTELLRLAALIRDESFPACEKLASR